MPETIRVLEVGKYYPPAIGGMEVLVRSIAQKLANRSGIEVEVLVSNEGGPASSEQDGRVGVTRLRRVCHLRGAPVTPGFVGRFRQLHGFDLVHIHSPNPAAELAWLVNRPRPKLVASAWGQIRRQRLLKRAYDPIYRAYFRRSSAIAMPSLRYAQTYDVLDGALARFKQVPVGLDPEVLRVTPSVSERMSEFRRRYPGTNVLFVGRLVSFKGAETLVRAAPDFKAGALIVGDGPLRANLEHLSRSLGVEDRIHFLGTLRGEEMVAAYNACDIYAQTSINASEAYSGSLIEAGFCGKPAVSTDIGSGTSEVNLHGETGLVVPPCDPKALASAVRTLEEDTALRERLGSALRERVMRNHTIDHMVDKLEQCYREVLAG